MLLSSPLPQKGKKMDFFFLVSLPGINTLAFTLRRSWARAPEEPRPIPRVHQAPQVYQAPDVCHERMGEDACLQRSSSKKGEMETSIDQG